MGKNYRCTCGCLPISRTLDTSGSRSVGTRQAALEDLAGDAVSTASEAFGDLGDLSGEEQELIEQAQDGANAAQNVLGAAEIPEWGLRQRLGQRTPVPLQLGRIDHRRGHVVLHGWPTGGGGGRGPGHRAQLHGPRTLCSS